MLCYVFIFYVDEMPISLCHTLHLVLFDMFPSFSIDPDHSAVATNQVERAQVSSMY